MNLIEKPTKELIKKIFRQNRNKLINHLTNNVKNVDFSNSILFLKGAYEIPVYDEDVEYVLRPETFFYYFFGVADADCYSIIDLKKGTDYLFIPKMDANKAVWFKKRDIDEFKEDYDITNIHYISDMEKIINDLKVKNIYLNNGINPYSGLSTLIPDIEKDFKFILENNININKDFIYEHLCEIKITKTEDELKLMKYSCEIASRAHENILKLIKPNVKEIFLRNQFSAFCQNTGSLIEPYSGIFGSGKNAAVLHYNFNHDILEDGKLILIDAGSYNNYYASDLTITSPINGKFTDKQKTLYNIVLKLQDLVFKLALPGNNYQSIQNSVEKLLIEELIKINILKNEKNESIDQLWEKRLSYTFFPHGIGHYIGIATHDHPGLKDKENEFNMKLSKQNLRVKRKLEKNMVLTNEPGMYFIDTLINKVKNDNTLNSYFNFDLIKEYQKEVDGIRIEDVYVVRENQPEILSNKVRTVEEIEKMMLNN